MFVFETKKKLLSLPFVENYGKGMFLFSDYQLTLLNICESPVVLML